LASGASIDQVARRYKIGRDITWRHRKHISEQVVARHLAGVTTGKALRERAVEDNVAVLDDFARLRGLLMGAIVRSAEANAASPLAMLSNSMVNVLTRIGRITGEIEKNNPSVAITNNNVAVLNDQRMVEEALLDVARAVPAAREAIARHLRDRHTSQLARGLTGSLPIDGARMLETAVSGLPRGSGGPPTIEGSINAA
jgi:hypothetical protein